MCYLERGDYYRNVSSCKKITYWSACGRLLSVWHSGSVILPIFAFSLSDLSSIKMPRHTRVQKEYLHYALTYNSYLRCPFLACICSSLRYHCLGFSERSSLIHVIEILPTATGSGTFTTLRNRANHRSVWSAFQASSARRRWESSRSTTT